MLTTLFSNSFYGQTVISDKEYEVYNSVLKQIFTERNYPTSGTKTVPLVFGDYEFPNLTSDGGLALATIDYREFVTDSFYAAFLQLNDKRFKIDSKKITLTVYSSAKKYNVFLSRCLIHKDYAMVYIGVQFASLDGEGNIYILKYNDIDKSWTIVKKVRTWVS